jgi:hypothetical protein
MAEEEKTENKKITDAKVMSKIFKVIAVVGIITCHILKWCGKLSAESTEICFMWAVVYGLGAGTIDLNIMLDKFRRKEE